MKQKLLTILIALCALAGMTNTAQAAEKTVTYTFIAEYANYNVSRWTLTFTPSNPGFGYSTGEKTATIENTSSTTGFTVELDDGLKLTYSQDEGHLTFWGSNGFYLNGTNDGGNSQLKLTSSHYYVTHVKMATTSGSVLTGTASPWMTDSGQLDQDVDMVTQYEGPADYREFSASFTYAQVFGQLTVTYGDPRPYAITFNDAVNGQNGVTNTNPTSYNVTTNTFDITAPSRTGYTLSGTTYTDAANPGTNHINLNMAPLRIYRGEAATRKAITLNASWTAHQYTLRLHHNDGTDDYDDVAMTYDVAHTLPALSRTGYVLAGWNTQADGNGNSYADGESVMNLTAEQGAMVELYAQWANPSGTCGPSATWEYDHASRTLIIGGSGEMSSYAENNAPWQNYKSYIETVSIGSGITEINNNAFYNCSVLANVTGGSGITFVDNDAFVGTPWAIAAEAGTTVTYLGHVAYIGRSVSGDVTIQDGTVCITACAFLDNKVITSVTIPASVSTIESSAFNRCHALANVNVFATTPPELGSDAFGLVSNRYRDRTFNVRSAAYKTADGWKDIYNKEGNYEGHTGTEMRVVSTLALPDGVTASVADDDKVTILGNDYYAEGTTVTLSGCSLDVVDHGNFTMGMRYVVSYNDGEARTDRYTPDANGQATFTMPAADVTVTTESYVVSVVNEITYIDADGTEQTCTDFTVLESRDANVGLGTNGEINWYVVIDDVTINGSLKFKDSHSHIIICDGATLTVNGAEGKNPLRNDNGSTTFYGQTIGSGTVNVTASSSAYSGILALNDITINGGTLNATGGIGIGIIQGTLTQNGGTINATGGIGIGIMQGNLTQNGGTLNATGSNGNGITAQNGSTVNILGGTLTATGSANDSYTNSGITANSSTVTLGWTNAADRITASSYYTYSGGTISVKSGQTLCDSNGNSYEGTLNADQLDALAGETLQPAPTVTTETKALVAGWNWFSTNHETLLEDLKIVLKEAMLWSDFTIQSQAEYTKYYGERDRWQGGITWDVAQMYMINVSESCEIILEGTSIDPAAHPVTIAEGDNWIGFPFAQNMSVANAFAGFAENGDIIISQTASACYTNGTWKGTLKNLEPGQGYIYKSAASGNRTFTYPIEGAADSGSNDSFNGDSYWEYFDYHSYRYNRPVVAAIKIDGQYVTADDYNLDDMEVAAFVDGECRGNRFTLTNRYVENDVEQYPVLDGMPIYYDTAGKAVSFKLYANGNEYSDCEILYEGEPLTIKTGEDHVEGWMDPEHPIILSFTNPTVNLVLSDNGTNADAIEQNNNQRANVTLQGRTLYRDGDWNTLCLPFDVTISGSILEEATIKKLSTSSNLTNGTLTLYFEDETTTLHAGTPYIIMWENPDEDIENPVFRGVTISSTEPTPVVFTGGSFVGQYSLFAIDDTNINSVIMLSSGNRLGYSNTNRTLRPFRCHFEVPADGSEPGARNIVLDFGDETSSMHNSECIMLNWADAWYSLDGRKLDNVPTKKGVYIVNSKKVIIK